MPQAASTALSPAAARHEAQAFWRLRRRVFRKADFDPPHMLRDFVGHALRTLGRPKAPELGTHLAAVESRSHL